jgi:hypothetical protein
MPCAGDAEDDEGASAGDDDGLDELSDTNAPYAEEAQPAAGSKGAHQLQQQAPAQCSLRTANRLLQPIAAIGQKLFVQLFCGFKHYSAGLH